MSDTPLTDDDAFFRAIKAGINPCAVIKNLLYRRDSQFVEVGDLFCDADGLHWIPYEAFQSAGNPGFAGLLGGAVGVLADSLLNQDSVPNVGGQRDCEWGMRVTERVARHPTSFTIDRADVKDIHSSGKLVITTSSGGQKAFGFIASKASYGRTQVLVGYSLGDRPPDDLNQVMGLGGGLPSPTRFIRMLLGEVEPFSQEEVSAIAANADYLSRLGGVLRKMPEGELERISTRLATMPEAIRKRFLSFFTQRLGRSFQTKPCVVWFFVSVVSVAGGIFWAVRTQGGP